MPVWEHNEMLSTQFLLGAHLQEWPDHPTIKPPRADGKKGQAHPPEQIQGQGGQARDT